MTYNIAEAIFYTS